MYPTICKIGPFTIYSYGLMLAIAVVVCTFLIARKAKQQQIAAEMIYDLVFVTILSGIAGARAFYVLLNFEYFKAFPFEVLMVQNGGLAWQGGLIAGFCACIWFLKKKKLDIFTILDLVAPYVALGQAIGRIGCFLNGCCYGRPWARGIYFPVHGDHLHPTQLYLTAGYVLIFLILMVLQLKKYPKGYLLSFYIMGAATLRFVVEFFRADHHVTLAGLSIFQFMSLAFILVAFFILKKSRRKNI